MVLLLPGPKMASSNFTRIIQINFFPLSLDKATAVNSSVDSMGVISTAEKNKGKN